MVRSTNYAMVSTLAGLQRLEAQIQRAMLEASGKPHNPAQQPEKVANRIEQEAQRTSLRANSVLNGLDLTA